MIKILQKIFVFFQEIYKLNTQLEHFKGSLLKTFKVDVDTNEKITFAQMKDATIRLALWLRQQNIGSGDVIGLCANSRIDNYLPLLATLFEGAIFCSWHHEITLCTVTFF